MKTCLKCHQEIKQLKHSSLCGCGVKLKKKKSLQLVISA
ncbi:hypothetical protein QY97_00637 [Bacillus thermotolerans]|uniref:Uncharacterized protein n=1 Tax=Bacillus thermotolerans TaxID=1221996 RepID=A0A0F5HUG1_BACTR|nr:hypothetical protein QY97_00637 [Bacillus thermotolerans]KKB39613.1 hypothetical protein QY95_02243 [Bacillus thermotolerans]KKB44465.1 hypothetical protein QY96_02593 [Bacillus thermotolerans]